MSTSVRRRRYGGGMRMADHPSVEVSLAVAASPESVWTLVSDVTRVGGWGAECVAAQWVDGAEGPAVGARFLGHQSREGQEWATTSVVVESDPGISFAWAVGDPANATATWRYQLDFDGSGGTVLRYRVVLGPGPSRMTPLIAAKPHLEERIIADRLAEHERNMTATLEAIRQVAETRP
ncbi:MAG: SRPBCC family protein [Pseudonocardiaceae bacterium]